MVVCCFVVVYFFSSKVLHVFGRKVCQIMKLLLATEQSCPYPK